MAENQTTALATIDRAGQELDRLSSEAQALSIFDGCKFSTAVVWHESAVEHLAARLAAQVTGAEPSIPEE